MTFRTINGINPRFQINGQGVLRDANSIMVIGKRDKKRRVHPFKYFIENGENHVTLPSTTMNVSMLVGIAFLDYKPFAYNQKLIHIGDPLDDSVDNLKVIYGHDVGLEKKEQ